MKEDLIKELVANSKFTNRINLQYQQKMELLEKENTRLKAELNELQTNLQQYQRLSPTSSKDPSKVEL
jgi:cell division protein FtsB